jgi:hypothetical protein
MLKLENTKTGETLKCIGVWANGVKNPRKVYMFGDTSHHLEDFDPPVVEFERVEFSHGSDWKVFRILKPWRVKN